MSRFLVEEAGLKRGGRVAVWKTNEPRCFDWFLAIIRAGGIAVPLNPLMPWAEVKTVLARCGASTLVTDAEHFTAVIQSRGSLPFGCWIRDRGPGVRAAGAGWMLGASRSIQRWRPSAATGSR